MKTKYMPGADNASHFNSTVRSGNHVLNVSGISKEINKNFDQSIMNMKQFEGLMQIKTPHKTPNRTKGKWYSSQPDKDVEIGHRESTKTFAMQNTVRSGADITTLNMDITKPKFTDSF